MGCRLARRACKVRGGQQGPGGTTVLQVQGRAHLQDMSDEQPAG